MKPAPTMKRTIQTRLRQLETDQDVRILYAVESGSRAWGFPSRDSDYDVRFIYVRPPHWYLSVDLERKRDVIEFPVDDDLDISGWDLRKALQLLHKSNPPLLEWFSSPIVYQTDPATIGPLQALAPDFFSPAACMHHYRRIAQQNYKRYAESGNRALKKYFYALRCLLAYKWIAQGLGIVPMPFMDLVDELVTDPVLRQQIIELVALKQTSRELDATPQIVALETYLENELAAIEGVPIDGSSGNHSIESLNAYFRTTLSRLWPDG